MSCKMTKMTVVEVEKIHDSWRCNQGSKSLYQIAKRFKITLNEAYAILATPRSEAILRAKRGKYFTSLA